MQRHRRGAGRFWSVPVLPVVLVASLTACGGRSMPFPVPENEMPPAPGLLTGETGIWEVPLARNTAPAKPADPTPGGVPR